MLFMPVQVKVSAGEHEQTLYSGGPGVFGKKLEALARSAGDMTEPLGEIGQDLRMDVMGAFAAEGAYGGNPAWRPLSQPYGQWKQRHAPGAPILVGVRHSGKGSRQHPNRGGNWVLSGRMRDVMISPTALFTSPRRVLYAPDSDIAGYHEFGTSRMPARPPVQINPGTLARWDGMWVRWLDRLVKEHGL